jgi:hypothetical protein
MGPGSAPARPLSGDGDARAPTTTWRAVQAGRLGYLDGGPVQRRAVLIIESDKVGAVLAEQNDRRSVPRVPAESTYPDYASAVRCGAVIGVQMGNTRVGSAATTAAGKACNEWPNEHG